ncbi:MAG: coproporphyrinogen-III oxidase family protein, partial [Gemmatimonadales bacterium]
MHLYVHVPFCSRRCSYCDFAIAVRRSVPSIAFVAAVEREWAMRQQEPGWNGSTGLATVYFGGGTPSRLEPEAIAALIGRFRRDRGIANDAEITLEANPEDVTAENAEGWQSAGVNRVSLGAQSFHPPTLAWMHRTHDAARIGTAVLTLRNAGFDNLSLDLIYGVPDALSRDWDADLDQALGLEPEHLSLYALTIEPLTPLGRWTSRGEAIPAPDDRAADEFLLAHDRLEQSG